MSRALHPVTSMTVGTSAVAADARLRADAAGRVTTATAAALSALAPLLRTRGLAPTALPATAARPTAADELGSVEVTFRGRETDTGWPALTARVLVAPRPGGGARLVLLTPRTPRTGLATGRLGRPHRERLTVMALRRVLHELARDLGDAGDPPSRYDHLADDDRPRFVHHLAPVRRDPDQALATLRAVGAGLTQHATDAAVRAAAPTLAAGGFRAPADPQVAVGPALDPMAALEISWRSDEEASGWPALTLSIALEAYGGDTRLAVLSTREPRYDISVNRVDKHARDRILSGAGRDAAEALATAVATCCPARRADRGRVPVAALAPGV